MNTTFGTSPIHSQSSDQLPAGSTAVLPSIETAVERLVWNTGFTGHLPACTRSSAPPPAATVSSTFLTSLNGSASTLSLTTPYVARA